MKAFGDSALALPPLITTLARRLTGQTRIWCAHQGLRGRGPVDLEGLAQLRVRVSRLVHDHPSIQELDINPWLAAAHGASPPLVALDARNVIQPREGEICSSSRPALRPDPIQYAHPRELRDGTPVTIRPIRPEDEPRVNPLRRQRSR